MVTDKKALLRPSNIWRFIGMGTALLFVLMSFASLLIPNIPPLEITYQGQPQKVPPFFVIFAMGALGGLVSFWPQIKEVLGVNSIKELLPWGNKPVEPPPVAAAPVQAAINEPPTPKKKRAPAKKASRGKK